MGPLAAQFDKTGKSGCLVVLVFPVVCGLVLSFLVAWLVGFVGLLPQVWVPHGSLSSQHRGAGQHAAVSAGGEGDAGARRRGGGQVCGPGGGGVGAEHAGLTVLGKWRLVFLGVLVLFNFGRGLFGACLFFGSVQFW